MPKEVTDVLEPFGLEINSVKVSTNDFKICKVLGRGTFGKVSISIIFFNFPQVNKKKSLNFIKNKHACFSSRII